MLHWYQNRAKEQIISEFFYFTLSGRKTHIKTCKTWISWRKPVADKPNCVPMFPHPSLQQQNKQGALKNHKNNFVQIPAVLFTNLTNSEAWLENCWGEQKTPPQAKPNTTPPTPAPRKTVQKTTWEEDVVPCAHFCTSSSAACKKADLPHLCMGTSSSSC